MQGKSPECATTVDTIPVMYFGWHMFLECAWNSLFSWRINGFEQHTLAFPRKSPTHTQLLCASHKPYFALQSEAYRLLTFHAMYSILLLKFKLNDPIL